MAGELDVFPALGMRLAPHCRAEAQPGGACGLPSTPPPRCPEPSTERRLTNITVMNMPNSGARTAHMELAASTFAPDFTELACFFPPSCTLSPSAHPTADIVFPICCLCPHSTMELAPATSIPELPNVNFHLKTVFRGETGQGGSVQTPASIYYPNCRALSRFLFFLLRRKACFHRRISPLCVPPLFTVLVFTSAFYLRIILAVSRI